MPSSLRRPGSRVPGRISSDADHARQARQLALADRAARGVPSVDGRLGRVRPTRAGRRWVLAASRSPRPGARRRYRGARRSSTASVAALGCRRERNRPDSASCGVVAAVALWLAAARRGGLTRPTVDDRVAAGSHRRHGGASADSGPHAGPSTALAARDDGRVVATADGSAQRLVTCCLREGHDSRPRAGA